MIHSVASSDNDLSVAKSFFALILLGPPGSGKGTHALPLSEYLGLPHLSTGDLFRSHLRNRTELGIQANGYIQKGDLVPDELVISMVADRISYADCQRGYLLDGFPRTLSQAKEFTSLLMGEAPLMVIHFDLSDEIVVDRVSGRLACEGCTKNYHRLYNPPKIEGVCDDCHSPLYQRGDDQEQVILQRLSVYHAQTAPVVDFYARGGHGHYLRVDASLPKEEVLASVLEGISPFRCKNTSTR